MRLVSPRTPWSLWILLAAFAVTTAVYWPGLYGGFLFDDYPNIVDNHGVQPTEASVPALVRAALSSPSSEFKRPLASLSFAANYLATGLDPYWMKLTNVCIHLLNGLLVFLLTRLLLRAVRPRPGGAGAADRAEAADAAPTPDATGPVHADDAVAPLSDPPATAAPAARATGIAAALVAAAWMLLPINLTGVLYVVQRMESMANLFVLLGLIGYTVGRAHMLPAAPTGPTRAASRWGLVLCVASVTVPTALGLLAKETAVMLPLYALLVEWIVFGFRLPAARPPARRFDRGLLALFTMVLALPLVAGLAWQLPHLLRPSAWATRDFTLGTRLLSEARIVLDYVVWTLLPTPQALSFYHDDFRVSTGLLAPWTTLASMAGIAALLAIGFRARRRRPLVALGIALFFGCQLLTGTILPLELIYEHRNYFASFGLMLALVPLLAAPPPRGWSPSALMRADEATPDTGDSAPGTPGTAAGAHAGSASSAGVDAGALAPGSHPGLPASAAGALPLALPRYVLLGGLLLFWTGLTAVTSYAWGNPLRLAEDLAQRAPESPRAQYELGRTYVIYSHYDPASPFTRLAYAPLERSAALPDSSVLPEQALIFMNARMHLPLKAAWWDSMIAKLKAHPPGVQDESSLGALTQCARGGGCDLPKARMMEAFLAALSHPNPSARLLATYGDYAWNVLNDEALGIRMTQDAVAASPSEPAYRITLVRMFAAQGRTAEAKAALGGLAKLNIGGRLDDTLAELGRLIQP